MEIKVGDKVMLKSGGPLMTVVTVYVDKKKRAIGYCECSWFFNNGAWNGPYEQDFRIETLVVEK